jgi:hypothetical protein
MMRRNGFGISVDVPAGWAHAIVRRGATPHDDVSPLRGAGPQARPGVAERTLPVVHVSSRPIPAAVGDFGSGAVERLGPDDVFVALLEYGTDLADTGLFERPGFPRLAPSQFSPARMPRRFGSLSASQHFFSTGGRAFCLYTVIGSHNRRMATVPRAAVVARSVTVESAARMRARGVHL